VGVLGFSRSLGSQASNGSCIFQIFFRTEREFGDAVMVSGVLVNVEGRKEGRKEGRENREVWTLVFRLTGLEVQGSSMAGEPESYSFIGTKRLQSLNSLHLGFWKTCRHLPAPFARQMSN
jgi:hypothetical protein